MTEAIFKKFDELFDKHITAGLIISTPRSCGKTTWMLKKAVELAEKNCSIKIIVSTPQMKEHLKKLLRKNSLKKLFTFKIGTYLKTRKNLSVIYFVEPHKETQYTFYDEPFGKLVTLPLTLHIGTISRPNHFTFDKSWVAEPKFIELKRSMGEKKFREEYENNIISKEE